MAESERNQYKEKFRPDADAALDREIEDALAGVSIDNLYGSGKPRQRTEEERELAAKGLRRGKILSIGPDDVFVDFGGKAQGIVPTEQLEPLPEVGQEMEFHVDRFDPREGLLILSRPGSVAAHVSWDNLEIGQIVEGEITGMNKGGLEMTIKGMRAFMPAGQVDVVFHKDISVFIGQRVQAEVTQFERNQKNMIVSRRNIMEREKEANRQKMLAELTEGQICRGTVRKVEPFGAFVDIGGADGLIHVSEMSHRRVKSPDEVVKVGDVVDVKIIRIDKEAGKIGLSLKQAMADPWQHAAERYAVGTAITGRVARVEAFGAFLEAEEGIEGLLPVSEMSWQRIRHPSDVVKEGDTIKVVVISLDPLQKRMSFSLKQAGGDPWAGIEGKYMTDMVVPGKVTRTAEFGAFVELEAGLEGLVHVSEISEQRIRSAGDVLKPGQDVRVRVLEVDKDRRRISLSIRRANEPAVEAPVAVADPAKKKKRPQLRGGLEF